MDQLSEPRRQSLIAALTAIPEPERDWFAALLVDYRALAKRLRAIEQERERYREAAEDRIECTCDDDGSGCIYYVLNDHNRKMSERLRVAESQLSVMRAERQGLREYMPAHIQSQIASQGDDVPEQIMKLVQAYEWTTNECNELRVQLTTAREALRHILRALRCSGAEPFCDDRTVSNAAHFGLHVDEVIGMARQALAGLEDVRRSAL